MITRSGLIVSSVALMAACSQAAPALPRPSAASLLQQARTTLAQATSFHARIATSMQGRSNDGTAVGVRTTSGFDGWVAGDRDLGKSRVADVTVPVIRIGDRLYTYATPEYLRSANSDATLRDRWIATGAASTAGALMGVLTQAELLRILQASDKPRDLGDTTLDGQRVTRLSFTSAPGVTVTLYVRGKDPLPTRIEASAPAQLFQTTIELDRYGEAPAISAPANAVDPLSP